MTNDSNSPTTPKDQAPATEPVEERNWDVIFGVLLSIFAATLAINDLGAGKFGEDEIQLTTEKSNIYQWYSSKGIKETLVEGQRDLLNTLMLGGAVSPGQTLGMQKMSADLDEKIKRFKKEKKEILLGSRAVGQENWVQEIDGEFGKVIGAKEIETKVARLSSAGDRFDLATLFLQLSIVMGAIGIVMKKENVKSVFVSIMSLLGVTGGVISVLAFRIALGS
jgi:hypothetical protein